MAETVLARMAVAISANTAEFGKALSQGQSQLKAFEKTISGVSTGLQAFGVGFGVYQIVGGLKSAIGTVSDFEKRMSEVKAITGATGKEFDSLRKNALELGSATLYSAEQVAGLQVAYGRLGFTTKEIVAATKATIDLATATGEDLAKSADIVGSTIRAFGLGAEETGRVTDVMASSFNKTALGLENFGEAMKYVAPVAAQAGISIEETTALLGTLADAGIRGSQAGTSLRKIISDVGGETGTLSEKLKKLADKGISGAQAMDEVGRTAYASLLILANATGKTDDLATALKNATGETEKMAAAMSDNLAGDVTKLTSAWDGFLLSIGNTAPFRAVTQGLTDLLTLVRGDSNQRLLLEGLAASITTGFNLDKAIANVAEFRKELGKPINIGQFESIIEKYNLTENEVKRLKVAIDEVNKSMSEQEVITKNFNAFKVKYNYADASAAAHDYIDSIYKLIATEQELIDENTAAKTSTGDNSIFDEAINKSDLAIAGYKRVITTVEDLGKASKDTAAKIAEPLNAVLPLIPALEAEIKRLTEAQRSSFSVDGIRDYQVEIERLKEQLKDLTAPEKIFPKFDPSAFNEGIKEAEVNIDGLSDHMDAVQNDAYAFMTAFNAIGDPIQNISAGSIEAFKKMAESAAIEFARIESIMSGVNDSINNLIAGAITDLSFALGESLGGSADFGESILKAAVNFAKQLSGVLISAGIAIEAFKTAGKSGNGYLLIAAGIALGIAAGVASSQIKSASRGLGSGSSGGTSRANPGSTGSLNGNAFEVQVGGEFRIQGQDLVYIINRQNQLSSRTTG